MYTPLDDSQTPGIEYIYAAVFGLRTDGTFVEVGAHDGKSYSCTYFLAQKGWNGFYIEAMQHLFQRCVENHKGNRNITTINAVVGTGNVVRMMHDHSDFFYSGNADFAKKHGGIQFVGEYTTVSLDNLLEQQKVQRKFELLVIDVEGMEIDVLKSFNIIKYKPKLVVIEMHELDPNAEVPERTEYIHRYFAFAGYTKIYTSPINSIFLRDEL